MTSSNGNISALLAICVGNSPVPGEFPAQRPVTRSFDVFFDMRLNKRLSKQSWGWWFETLSRHYDVTVMISEILLDGARPITDHHYDDVTERHVVPNHRSFDCLFNSLCGATSKKHQSPHYCLFVRWIQPRPVDPLKKDQ